MSSNLPQRSIDNPQVPLVPDISHHVERLGDHFLDLLHAGQAPDRQQVVQAYQELAERLEQRLALIELMFGRSRDP